MGGAISQTEWRAVAKEGALQLGVVRRGAGGLGSIIHSPEARELIDGIQIEPLRMHPDDRGFFEEIFRWGQGLSRDFGSAGSVQVSAALSYPGTIKAIHYHLRQTDLWTPVLGMLQVMLYDLRTDSPTFGKLNTLYVGNLQPWQIRIPQGVGHGYKVVGTESALLVYATDRWYDPADEGRLPWNDPDVNYDWETQHR